MESVACTERLDDLLQPLPRTWSVEFYGDGRLLRGLLHRVAACRARYGPVAVALVQEFEGLDPYEVRRHARALGSSVDRVYVARAFRLEAVPGLIDSVPATTSTVVVVDPYLYSPLSPEGYSDLAPVTAAIRRAVARGVNVVVFNSPTRFGTGYRPEGGSFHHHSIHVIARVSRCGKRRLYVELVKHPHRPLGRVCVPESEVGYSWGGQPLLLEWL